MVRAEQRRRIENMSLGYFWASRLMMRGGRIRKLWLARPTWTAEIARRRPWFRKTGILIHVATMSRSPCALILSRGANPVPRVECLVFPSVNTSV